MTARWYASLSTSLYILIDCRSQRACNLQHIIETPLSSPSTSTPSPSTTEHIALPPRWLDLGVVKTEAARQLCPKPALPAINPADLKPYGILGSGGQGTVSMVLHIPTGNMYAMKTILKDKLTRAALEFVFREQTNSLEVAGCPNVAQLLASWEDRNHLYLLFVRRLKPLVRARRLSAPFHRTFAQEENSVRR